MALFRYYLPSGKIPSFGGHRIVEAHDIEAAAQAICRKHGLSRTPDGMLIAPWREETEDSSLAIAPSLRAASA